MEAANITSASAAATRLTSTILASLTEDTVSHTSYSPPSLPTVVLGLDDTDRIIAIWSDTRLDCIEIQDGNISLLCGDGVDIRWQEFPREVNSVSGILYISNGEVSIDQFSGSKILIRPW